MPSQNPTFLEMVLTAQWWANNIGQILGAAFGAFLAYIFGYILQRASERKETLVRDKINASQELRFLSMMDEAIRKMRGKFSDAREEKRRRNCYYQVQYTQIMKSFEGLTWQGVSDVWLAEEFEKLIDLARALEEASGECHSLYDDTTSHQLEIERTKADNTYEKLLTEAELLTTSIAKRLAASDKKAKAILGLR